MRTFAGCIGDQGGLQRCAVMRDVATKPGREELIAHGAVVNHCKHEGCTRQAIKGGVSHMERLNHERNATTRVKKSGLCTKH